MWFYPGGSYLDLSALGHDFWRNFLCDLLNENAINGTNNRVGAILMQTAMGCLIPGLGILWWYIPNLFPTSRRLGAAVRISGTLSLFGFIAVPLTPPHASYVVHAAAIFSAGVPALLAWVLSLVALRISSVNARWVAGVGYVAASTAFVGVALYARELFFDVTRSVWLPTSNRIATILLLVWILSVAQALHRTSKRDVFTQS